MKRYLLPTFFALLILGPDPLWAQGNPSGPPGRRKGVDIHFVVKWDGKTIPGITRVSALRRKTEIVEYRSGGEPSLIRRSPGKTEYPPLILKRPRSKDPEFERWANKVWNFGAGLGAEASLKDYRKDIQIELRDDKGRILMAFRVYRCWPAEYVALSDLDVEDHSPAMEILVLEHEGWERDDSIR